MVEPFPALAVLVHHHGRIPRRGRCGAEAPTELDPRSPPITVRTARNGSTHLDRIRAMSLAPFGRGVTSRGLVPATNHSRTVGTPFLRHAIADGHQPVQANVNSRLRLNAGRVADLVSLSRMGTPSLEAMSEGRPGNASTDVVPLPQSPGGGGHRLGSALHRRVLGDRGHDGGVAGGYE